MSSTLRYFAEAEALLNCKTVLSENGATQSTLKCENLQHVALSPSDAEAVGPGGSSIDHGAPCVEKALGLLLGIHREAGNAEKHRNESDGGSISLVDHRCRQVIEGLLDVVVLQGICPFLSAGVGTPYDQRVRITTYNGVRRCTAHPRRNLSLVSKVIYLLCDMSENSGVGIEPFIRDLILPDVVCGAAELAYSPCWACEIEERDVIHKKFRPILNKFLDT